MLAHNKMYADKSLSDEKVANFCFMAHGDKEDEVMAQGNKEDEENEVILESPSTMNYLKFFQEINLIQKNLVQSMLHFKRNIRLQLLKINLY